MNKIGKVMSDILGVSAIILLLSLFIANVKIFTITFTIFILLTIINCCLIQKENSDFKLFGSLNDKSEEYYKNKKYGKSFVYAVTYPMIIIGLCLGFCILGIMWMRAF